MGKWLKRYTIHFYVVNNDGWTRVATHRYWSKRRIIEESEKYCAAMSLMGVPARTQFGKDI